MNCPVCTSQKTKCYGGYYNKLQTMHRRNYRCESCKSTFSTVEMYNNNYRHMSRCAAAVSAFSEAIKELGGDPT